MTVQIIIGDARQALSELADGSVHCVITSPPYWGLRAYGGDAGMIGLEPTFDAHLENLVDVFREVWRVLRDDGTLWLNYGDAYCGGGRGDYGTAQKQKSNAGSLVPAIRGWTHGGLKPKDLLMMPARVAMALQDDGWWLRSEIIWHKPNPMPESVKDRPTSAHEKLFLLSKSKFYFYDADAVRLPSITGDLRRPYGSQGAWEMDGRPPEQRHGGQPRRLDKQRGHSRRHDGFNDRWDDMSRAEQKAMGANRRNVWTIAPAPFQGAHFATFPPALIEPAIKAGTSAKGCCSACGAPWKRVTEVEYRRHEKYFGEKSLARRHSRGAAGASYNERIATRTTDWVPSCDCEANLVPAVVLDPFGGAGTVGLVADRLGRDAVLVEINADYAAMSRRRIRDDRGGLFETQEGDLS